MSEDNEKSISRPFFNGKRENFQVYWTRMTAYATVKKFRKSMTEKKATDLPATETGPWDADADAKAVQEAAVERNAFALAQFTMSFKKATLVSLINKSRSADWPSGEAHIVVRELFRKYSPTDMVAQVEMKQDLARLKFRPSDSPADWFEELANLEVQYKTTMSETDKLATIMEKAPESYHTIIANEQARQAGSTTFDLDNLEEAMNNLYRLNNPRKPGKKGKDDESEVALAGVTDRVCFLCKKKGHLARNCPEKDKGGSGGKKGSGFKGNCFHCGQKGHQASDCWEKEENKDKRPNNWKSRMTPPAAESGAAAVSTCTPCNNTVEYYLCGVTFPANQDFLKNPNVFIADTAASTHMTPYDNGLVNVKEHNSSTVTMWGNGTDGTPKVVGDLPVTICDNKGMPVNRAVLTNVSHIPGSAFNLFSLSKMTTQGWKLQGDGDAIWITKDNQEIRFDIKIKTPTAAIFCGYFKRLNELGAPAVEAESAKDKAPRLSIRDAHLRLGHTPEDLTRKIASQLGWELQRGTLSPCDGCTVGKAKQKNLPTKARMEPLKDGEIRMYIDLATIKPKKGMPKPTKPNWCMRVLEPYMIKFSTFHETKDG